MKIDLNSLFIVLFLAWIIWKAKMENIHKYIWQIGFLSLMSTPVVVALIIFDHSMLSKLDLVKDTGMWFWIAICVIYTSVFTVSYGLTLHIIHPEVWKQLKIEYVDDDDDWKAIALHMVFWSIVAIIITYIKNGNFIHFIGNSIIVCGITHGLLLVSYFALEISSKKD
jgi:ABC-type Fe3+ transport system permease subunit